METKEITFRRNVPLAPLTTMKVGGVARFFLSAKDRGEVIKAINFAESEGLNVFILGGGSNVIIADEGFDGLVVSLDFETIEFLSSHGEQVLVRVDAGKNWDEFVSFCVERGLAGIECLSGIPGKVGGVPIQNVGAYGQEVSETILRVKVFDKAQKKVLELENQDCKFGYRTSIFNTTEKDRFIVLSVTFSLKKNGNPTIIYKDLVEFFDGRKPSLKDVRNAVIEIRRRKAMVIDENDPNTRSCGSFFKNPIVDEAQFQLIKEIARRESIRQMPFFPANGGRIKLSAAWLIENAGFYKGFRLGNVGISQKHSLAIVNFSNARASEILKIKDLIQAKVYEKFGIELVPEPVFVGFTNR